MIHTNDIAWWCAGTMVEPEDVVSRVDRSSMDEASEPVPTVAEMKLLHAQLEQRDRQLSALHRIGQALAATLDLREIYWVMFREIAQGLLGTPHLTVALFDQKTEMIYCGFAIVDGEEIDPTQLPRLPLGEGPVSDTIRTRQSRIVDLQELGQRLKAGGRAVQIGDERQPQSALYVPMVSGDRVVGVMHVQHYEADAFGETDVPLLSILASQAAIAIENAGLFEAEREQRALAEALRDTAAALNTTLNFDEVLDRILTNVGRVMPHDYADIMLVEGSIARVARSQAVAGRGLEAKLLAMPFPVADVPHLRQMMQTRQSLSIADTHNYLGWVDITEGHPPRSYAGAPIRLRGLIVGFLNLYSTSPGFFTAERAERLQVFADQAAVAIENANLYGEIQRHADALEWRVAERTRELAEANERLKELDRLKDQFVSNVNHELRTPLANTKLYLGLLEHGRPDKRDQYLQTLHRETARLSHLIEDLLELSRLDLGAAHRHLEPINVDHLAAELVGDRSAMAADRGLMLDCHLDPDLPLAQAESKRVVQVLTNLVTNAINYTPRNGMVTISSAVRRWQDSDWVTLTVQDTGKGISPEEMPNLFKRFFRGEAGHSSGAPGTGLGLAICKELVEKMGGQITVESQPGQGAAFTVWLVPADQ